MERVRGNLAALDAVGLDYLPVEAGWSVVVQVPQRLVRGLDGLALAMVREVGVVAHPASFYGMAMEHGLVLSLLGEAQGFLAGLRKLKSWCESRELTFGASD